MDTLFLVAYIAVLRALFFLASKKAPAVVKGKLLVLSFLVAIFLVPLPLVLIKKEVLDNSVLNILLAGLSIFYFAFVISRMIGKMRRY